MCDAALATARLPKTIARAAIAAKSILRIRKSSSLATAGHERCGFLFEPCWGRDYSLRDDQTLRHFGIRLERAWIVPRSG